ncbi:MAG: hypothetical protein MRZ98_02600, partial [Clostridiales bacterium]|nr:hypothetical protein [Clostridiales bacterium]
SDFGSETGGVYVGFGCLAQQGFPYALCRPASRRRAGKERFPSEKIALWRAFLTACAHASRQGACAFFKTICHFHFSQSKGYVILSWEAINRKDLLFWVPTRVRHC